MTGSGSTEQAKEDPQAPPQRAGCWLLVAAFLSVYQIIFALRVLQQQETLSLTSSVPPVVDAGISLIWGIVFAIIMLGLLRRRLWAGRWVRWLALGFVIYKTTYIAIFAQADYDRGRVPFLLVSTALILIIPLVITLRDARQLIDSR